MATVLTYQNEGDQPYCEVALDNGECIKVRLGRDGAVIERQARGERPAEILFKAGVDVVTDLCVALSNAEYDKKDGAPRRARLSRDPAPLWR